MPAIGVGVVEFDGGEGGDAVVAAADVQAVVAHRAAQGTPLVVQRRHLPHKRQRSTGLKRETGR